MRAFLFGLFAAACFGSTAAADVEPLDVQARYCLSVLDQQDELAKAAGRHRSAADKLLRSDGSRRTANRAALQRYLASRALGPEESEAVRKQSNGPSAEDITELLFAAPSRDCIQDTAGLCRLEAWARTPAAQRQSRCTGDLGWLPSAAESAPVR